MPDRALLGRGRGPAAILPAAHVRFTGDPAGRARVHAERGAADAPLAIVSLPPQAPPS